MTQPSQEVLLHGCYDNRNFGDVLMADMLSKYLHDSHNVQVRCPGMVPDVAEKLSCATTGLVAGPMTCSAAIFGGGGYLHGSSLRHAKRLLRYAIPATFLRARRIPYSIVGVGVGPQISRLSAPLIRNLCGGAKVVAVREPQSLELLSGIGVDPGKLQLTADLVMSLKSTDIPQRANEAAESLLRQTAICNRPKRLGVHLSAPANKTDLLHRVMQQVREGLAGEDEIAVYWLQDHGDRTEDFRKIAQQYLPSCEVFPPMDHWKLAAILGKMDAILTTKLHVAIAAWALKKPVCGFSNHQKTARFFSQIDRAPYQTMHDDDPKVICGWVEQFVKQDECFFADDTSRRDVLAKTSNQNFRLIDAILK